MLKKLILPLLLLLLQLTATAQSWSSNDPVDFTTSGSAITAVWTRASGTNTAIYEAHEFYFTHGNDWIAIKNFQRQTLYNGPLDSITVNGLTGAAAIAELDAFVAGLATGGVTPVTSWNDLSGIPPGIDTISSDDLLKSDSLPANGYVTHTAFEDTLTAIFGGIPDSSGLIYRKNMSGRIELATGQFNGFNSSYGFLHNTQTTNYADLTPSWTYNGFSLPENSRLKNLKGWVRYSTNGETTPIRLTVLSQKKTEGSTAVTNTQIGASWENTFTDNLWVYLNLDFSAVTDVMGTDDMVGLIAERLSGTGNDYLIYSDLEFTFESVQEYPNGRYIEPANAYYREDGSLYEDGDTIAASSASSMQSFDPSQVYPTGLKEKDRLVASSDGFFIINGSTTFHKQGTILVANVDNPTEHSHFDVMPRVEIESVGQVPIREVTCYKDVELGTEYTVTEFTSDNLVFDTLIVNKADATDQPTFSGNWVPCSYVEEVADSYFEASQATASNNTVNYIFTPNKTGRYRINTSISTTTNEAGAWINIGTTSLGTELYSDSGNRMNTANGLSREFYLTLTADTDYHINPLVSGGDVVTDFAIDITCWVEPTVVGESNSVSSRVGEMFYAKSGSTVQGYLPVTAGTVTNGAIDYPIWATIYPEFIVGDDIVFPSDVEGMFLRNLGGNAAAEGIAQADATDVNGLGTAFAKTFTSGAGTLSTPSNGNNASAPNLTIQITSTDPETRPANMAFQLYTIVDNYNEKTLVGMVTPTDNFIRAGRENSVVDGSETFTFATPFDDSDGTTDADIVVTISRNEAGTSVDMPITTISRTGFTIDRDNSIAGVSPFSYIAVNSNSLAKTIGINTTDIPVDNTGVVDGNILKWNTDKYEAGSDDYSITETLTLKTYLGKPVYRILVPIALANHATTTTLTTAHGIVSTVDVTVKIEAIVGNGTESYAGSHEDLDANLNLNGANIVHRYTGNWSAYSGHYIVEYTKQ